MIATGPTLEQTIREARETGPNNQNGILISPQQAERIGKAYEKEIAVTVKVSMKRFGDSRAAAWVAQEGNQRLAKLQSFCEPKTGARDILETAGTRGYEHWMENVASPKSKV